MATIANSRLMFKQPIEIVDGLCDLDLDRMAKAVVTWRGEHPASAHGANVGGWKSPYGALAREELAPAKEAISKIVGTSNGFSSWAMINGAGSVHPRHIHYGAIGGVLYLASGDPMAPLVVEDGHCEISVDPIPGRLVWWRRPLWHRVDRCASETPRISIAFEVQP